MKKTVKIFWIFLFVVILLSLGKNVQANSINKISMDIYVDQNGDAHITEVWDCYANEGTEVYHPYYNLGNSEIKDLIVSEGGNQYTTLSSWKTSGTLSSKSFKCGLNKISNGVEICWGISDYGSHTYEVKYTITRFVSELKDAQMIYWTLIPYDFSNTINDVYIKIHTDFHIEDTIDVWGYGNYGGTAYVYDGYIEMQPDGSLGSSEYMTILVKFPEGTFNCLNKLDNNFSYYLDMAEEGTTKYVDNNPSAFLEVIQVLIPMLLFVFFSFISVLAVANGKIHFYYGPQGKKGIKEAEYFRDIPCDGNIFRAYYIANKYGLVKDKTDLLGAIILKWIKDSLITVEQKENGMLFKKENMVVVLKQTNRELIEDSKEKELFQMLYVASNDGYLESKEFEKWCKKSYSKILGWFDRIIREQEIILIKQGLIDYEEKKALGGIFKNRKHIATPKLIRMAEELGGLRNYLLDFSLIEEKEIMEIRLFEEYLIYAQIMGIAKKVAKQFEDIYPEIIEQSSYVHYDNIKFVHTCSTRGVSNARSAKSVAEARASGYSSGGGGFSSGGGGGGSFGGGGGRRRFSLKK